MSGGSYNYLYTQIDDLAYRVEDSVDPRRERTRFDCGQSEPRVYSKETKQWIVGSEAQAIIDFAVHERVWFAKLLRAVAKAAHDIEWVDSGDYGPGDEVESIRAVRSVLEQPTMKVDAS